MITSTPEEIASNLHYDMGIAGGIRYAEKMAAYRGPLSANYARAAEILRRLSTPQRPATRPG